MYWNAERYADPTAGAALAHIAHEERMARRKAAEAKKRAEEKKKVTIRKQKQKEHWEAQKREREWRDTHTTWVKAWPKEQPKTIMPPRRTTDDTNAHGTC